MKASDALADILLGYGFTTVFGLQGGAVVHIFDSLERAGVRVVYPIHENSAALAAAAYAKVTGRVGCSVTTTGPGSTNVITALLGAWQDSVPCLFISGQVRSDHTSYGRPVRQVGTQEAKIIDIVRPITKRAVTLSSAEDLPNEVHAALEAAVSGRPGPVWIEIPMDYQWADIPYKHAVQPITPTRPGFSAAMLDEAMELLRNCRRPLIVAGCGIHLAGAEDDFLDFVERSTIPVVSSWTAADLLPADHSLNFGVIGMSGQKGANQAVFDADLLLCLGTHLSIPQTTTLFDSWSPQSKKIVVNIDRDQLDNMNVVCDVKIQADVADFFRYLLKEPDLVCNMTPSMDAGWPEYSRYREENWYEPEVGTFPNSYVFQREMGLKASEDSCFVIDGGGAAYVGFQAAYAKRGQRIICPSTMMCMGTGLAESIGVFMTNRFRHILCSIGDGSLAMCIHDLQTIVDYKIPVAICVYNNNGYLAIRHTQGSFLEQRFFGTHPDWGLRLPDCRSLAACFGLDYLKVDSPEQVDQAVDRLVAVNRPILCEVVVDESQPMLFRQAFRDNGNGTFSPLPLDQMSSGR